MQQTDLVTGGAGFIGSELVHQLIEEGKRVVVYDNFSFGRRNNLPEDERVVVVEGDLLDSDLLKKTVQDFGPQNVFHMAAIHFIPYCIQNPQETIRVNVEGTLNVLEASKDAIVKSVVYASTAAVYPIDNEPHKEDGQKGPIEIYGATKLFGESLLEIFHRDTGIKCASARLFNGYGLRETNPHVIPDILKQIPNGDEIHLGNITPKRDFIHTSDISRALRTLADSEKFGYDVFNVGTGKATAVSELVDIIAEIIDRPLHIKTAQDRMRDVERPLLVADTSKIQKVSGWNPQTPFKSGFKGLLESAGLL